MLAFNRAELSCLSVLFRNFQTKSTAIVFARRCVVPSLHDCLQRSNINVLFATYTLSMALAHHLQTCTSICQWCADSILAMYLHIDFFRFAADMFCVIIARHTAISPPSAGSLTKMLLLHVLVNLSTTLYGDLGYMSQHLLVYINKRNRCLLHK